jgi:hypothetical protein
MIYLEMLTPSEIRAAYPKYKIVKYNKALKRFEPVTSIPTTAVYQVVKGIEELELIDEGV